MKRKIFTGITAISLLIAQFASVSVVFSDEVQGKESIEQFEGRSMSTFDNTITNNVLNESIASVDQSIEKIEESTSEFESISEDSIENIIEEELSSSNSVEVEENEKVSAYTEETEIMEQDSTDGVEYEEVFYNGKLFKFPVQKEIDEVDKNLNDNHDLGTYTKSENYGHSNPTQITEEQIERPRWDFIDVSSRHGELSVADYEYMLEQGVTGVVVKLTEGTFYTNPFAEKQIKNAEKAGLKVSTYHFSRYTTKKGAENEAVYYVETARRMNLDLNTVMVNDLEVNLNEYSTQNAIFFANKVKELGFSHVLHYASEATLREAKYSASILGEEYLWIAEYPEEATEKNKLHSANAAWQWSNKMTFDTISEENFSVSSDYKGKLSNPDKKISKKIETTKHSSIISEKNINKYATILSNDFVFWKDLTFKEKNAMSKKYFQQTLFVEKEFILLDGLKFLSIKDKNNKMLGYIDSTSVEIVSGEEGAFQSVNKYVTIKGTSPIWANFSWTSNHNPSKYKNQTVKAKGKYHHFSGANYLSLYDSKDNWIGYINENGTKLGSGEQGAFHSINQYVTIKGTSPIWENFNWTNSQSPSKYKNQTVNAKGIYYHFSGSKYLSLYDNNNNWLGYINENGTKLGSGTQGAFHNINQYVTIKGDSLIWDSFNWSNSQSSVKYKNQTVSAKGIYYHFNGTSYLSLYDNKNNWIGYINQTDTKLGSGEQGVFHGINRYVTMKGNFPIWDGFPLKNKISSNQFKNQVFVAKGVYYHFDGSSYLSLYDSKDNWIGYIDEKGTTTTSSLQGNYQKYGKYVTIKSNNEPVYRNFNWTLQQTSNIGKETFQARGVYHHFNGQRYFSIYDINNKWIGYISEKSVDEKTTHLFVMGHGSFDPGAVGNGTSEREFTRQELLPYLKKYSKKLKNTEILFYDTSKNMFADSKNNQGVHNVHAGLASITEVHLDAAGLGATGGHVIVHPNKKSYKEDLELASVVKNYNGLWGGVTKTKGLSYRKDLLNLNLSHSYDVSYRLVELGFITNHKDLVKLRVNLDRIAKEFVEVVTGEKL